MRHACEQEIHHDRLTRVTAKGLSPPQCKPLIPDSEREPQDKGRLARECGVRTEVDNA